MSAKTFHARPVRDIGLANLVRQLGYYNVGTVSSIDSLNVAVFSGSEEDAERVRQCRFVQSVDEAASLVGLKRTN
ncbi:MAG: hypothetical protein Athens041674_548 [Parcubacteria group bacterium Athens0416_74]|nr:MAG: hypothetical protein Athens041674_548 [Parcubacteria group bacterium Athens0416_74]